MVGLPGNPVSTLVCALLFLKPALDRLSGAVPRRRKPTSTARLGVALPKERQAAGLSAREARAGCRRHARGVPVRGAGQLDDAVARRGGLPCRPPAARPRCRSRDDRADRSVSSRGAADLIGSLVRCSPARLRRLTAGANASRTHHQCLGFVPHCRSEGPMLTRKQRELLLFINQRLTATGVSPSFDEMKDALSLKSKSGIHRLVSGLEERGFIRRLPHRARALEVVKLPEESAVGSAAERSRFSPTVIRGDFTGSLPGTPVAPDVEAVDLPALRPDRRRHPDRGAARPEHRRSACRRACSAGAASTMRSKWRATA